MTTRLLVAGLVWLSTSACVKLLHPRPTASRVGTAQCPFEGKFAVGIRAIRVRVLGIRANIPRHRTMGAVITIRADIGGAGTPQRPGSQQTPLGLHDADCPLAVDGAEAEIVSEGDLSRVTVRAGTAKAGTEILKRAKLLLQPP